MIKEGETMCYEFNGEDVVQDHSVDNEGDMLVYFVISPSEMKPSLFIDEAMDIQQSLMENGIKKPTIMWSRMPREEALALL